MKCKLIIDKHIHTIYSISVRLRASGLFVAAYPGSLKIEPLCRSLSLQAKCRSVVERALDQENESEFRIFSETIISAIDAGLFSYSEIQIIFAGPENGISPMMG